MEGTAFGRYRLVKLLGRGGMGEVWRAHDTATDRIVALKLLPSQWAEDETFQERFRREAHAAARLNEPHVVPIHGYGEIDGRLYVDMRLIEGQDLQTILADGPLPPARAVMIIEQVARALNAAHKVGLVHRDVKPSNILVDEFDFAYLIDFGIARGINQTGLTDTGRMIGTWHYLAPERMSVGQTDPRSDVYALACVLHECLTGDRPFPGDTVERQVAAHLTTPPPRPSTISPGVSAAFDPVIATGMAKDPDQRYSTTMELAHAARNAITTPMPQPPVPPPPEQEPTRLAPATPHPGSPGNRPQPRRGPSAVVIALVGAALLIGGLLVFFGTRLSQQTSSSPSTVTIAPDTQVTSAPNSSVPPSPPTTTTAPAPPPPTTVSARLPGDLGLSTPMSRPACDGTGIVVLGNATNPGSYAVDVQRLLNEYPGASYLRTDQACPSLRQSLNGNPIYAVYRVAGGTEADICAAVRAAGGETYGKWLDTSSDPNSYIRPSC
jgi:serine/threonine-protein kinase